MMIARRRARVTLALRIVDRLAIAKTQSLSLSWPFFAFVRCASNGFGTILSRIDIVRAVATLGQPLMRSRMSPPGRTNGSVA